MKFFLDTANLDEIRKGAEWGIVDGVTTNPTLIAKEGKPIREQIAAICDIVDGPISAEVVSVVAKDMIREGRELSIAASLRGPTHEIESALAGAHIGTMPFQVMDMLFNHPLTDKGLDQFLKDYKKAFQSEPVGTGR
jgi:transaldolase